MAYTLEEFAANCREALQSDGGPGGRNKVREYLQRALRDQAFLDAHLGPNATREEHRQLTGHTDSIGVRSMLSVFWPSMRMSFVGASR